MLDDLKMIHNRDAQDALGAAAKQYQQLTYDFDIGNFGNIDTSKLTNIVCIAMGNSALAAAISQTWPGYRLPFEIIRYYDIPDYVSPSTLVIVISSSGDTEETISAVQQAQQRGGHGRLPNGQLGLVHVRVGQSAQLHGRVQEGDERLLSEDVV